MFPSARVRGYLDIFKEVGEVLQSIHRHYYRCILANSANDWFNEFLFRWGIFGEFPQPTSLCEDFHCILEVDAIVGKMPMALMEMEMFTFISSKVLCRNLGILDSCLLQVGECNFNMYLFSRHHNGCVLIKPTNGSFSFSGWFVFLLFLLEGIF